MSISNEPGSVTGTLSPTGLRIGGVVTVVTIDNSDWYPLPASPLGSRNTICIQNRSGQQIKINYNSSVSGYVGIAIDNGGERFYDITDDIVIYAKAISSSCSVNIEEIA